METTNIQLRGVPVETRERVRRRAAKQGRSMSEYVLGLIERDLSMPTMDEFARRLAKTERVVLDRRPARDIEDLRDERETSLDSRRRPRRTG